jgi:hypothetical protein
MVSIPISMESGLCILRYDAVWVDRYCPFGGTCCLHLQGRREGEVEVADSI